MALAITTVVIKPLVIMTFVTMLKFGDARHNTELVRHKSQYVIIVMFHYQTVVKTLTQINI